MELNKIHNIDCLEFMKTLPDKCIDLVLTDPPYGINIAKNGTQGRAVKAKLKNYGKSDWDKKIPSREYFDEMKRISKNQIIFGGNYFVEYLSNSPCWIVWDKILQDKFSCNFADCELIYTSFKSPARIIRYMWRGLFQGNDIGNTKYNEKRFHPTQKPVQVIQRLVVDFSNEGDIIFDPFLGSGTTAVACKILKRNYIGCEISPEYCKIAEDRIKSISNPLF